MTISGADTSVAKELAYTKAKEKGTYSLMRSFGGNGLHDVGILKGITYQSTLFSFCRLVRAKKSNTLELNALSVIIFKLVGSLKVSI